MSDQQSIQVKILGHKLSIRSEENKDYVTELANYINEKMGHLQNSTNVISQQNLAILTALNLADELFKEREKLRNLKSNVKAKSEALLAKLATAAS